MIQAGVIIYVLIGLLTARGMATYLTELFSLEDKHYKSIIKHRSKTYDEWFEKDVEHLTWLGDKRVSEYTEGELKLAYLNYLERYPSSSQIQVATKVYSWENDGLSKFLVLAMPLLWLPMIIGYYPAIILSKVCSAVIKNSIAGIDYLGKELANPKGNIRRNK